LLVLSRYSVQSPVLPSFLGLRGVIGPLLLWPEAAGTHSCPVLPPFLPRAPSSIFVWPCVAVGPCPPADSLPMFCPPTGYSRPLFETLPFYRYPVSYTFTVEVFAAPWCAPIVNRQLLALDRISLPCANRFFLVMFLQFPFSLPLLLRLRLFFLFVPQVLSPLRSDQY